MPIKAFDHVNLRTGQLDTMIAWYDDILGMTPGWRPDFPFPGAWLYLGDQALVHLVGLDRDVAAGTDLTLEHFALAATDMDGFRAKLDERGMNYEITASDILPVVQMNIWDPDGNHIHVDFDRSEYNG
ncbi:MAG: VOC family protein [Rhodobacteraceae bacterium]|nr:VOC family protein [Paracoccaceae bacterium]